MNMLKTPIHDDFSAIALKTFKILIIIGFVKGWLNFSNFKSIKSIT